MPKWAALRRFSEGLREEHPDRAQIFLSRMSTAVFSSICFRQKPAIGDVEDKTFEPRCIRSRNDEAGPPVFNPFVPARAKIRKQQDEVTGGLVTHQHRLTSGE
jgi:hypothetical protein